MGEGFGYLDERVGGAGRNRDGAMEGFGPKPRLAVRPQPLEDVYKRQLPHHRGYPLQAVLKYDCR